MENTAMITVDNTPSTETAVARKGIELSEGRILPGGIWEINPFNEEGLHPDDRMHPIGA